MGSHEHEEHQEREEYKKHKKHEEQEKHHECKKHEKDEYKKQEKQDDYKKHEKHEYRYEEEAKHKEPSEADKNKGKESYMESAKEIGEGLKMEGLHLKKRDLWLVAGGALGALAALGLGKLSGKVRPAAVGAVREGYAFKEWLAGKAEKVKEDVEDIVAEGVHQYHSNVAATADSVKREKDILEKIEQLVDRKLSKMKSEQGEG